VTADRIDHGETIPELDELFPVPSWAMSSTKARTVLAALLHIGWSSKRETACFYGILSLLVWYDYVFAFHG